MCGGFCAVALGVALMGAPAPLAWLGPDTTRDMAFMKDRVAFHVSVGGRFSNGETWANAVSIELMRRGVLAELRAEDFWRPTHIRYLTARAGYLWHPKGCAAGGLTAGYQHAEGATSQSGPELGLPLIFGCKSAGVLRLEPTYVLSGGPLWSYRLQVEAHLGGRYVVGANVIKKSLRLEDEETGELAPQAVMVVVGIRF